MAEPGRRSFFLVFLLDGAADRPCPALGGATPFAAASTPQLDALARGGAQGQLRTIPPECPPGSEVANLALLGYDPVKDSCGRGVLEAASMGIAVPPQGVTFRVNLITIQGNLITDHSAGHIRSREAAVLLSDLQALLGKRFPSFGLRLHPGVSYRHVLTIKQGSPHVHCTPPHDVLGDPYRLHLPRATNEGARRTAEFLKALIAASQEVLSDHPVNRARRAAGKRVASSLWPWSPGRKPSLASFSERWGLRGAVISAVDLIKGIGRLAGMTVLQVEGATGLVQTNYEGKAHAACEALADHDFVYVHVEGPDEAGHAGDPLLKRKAIEYCDRRLIAVALKCLREKGLLGCLRLAVLPDHATACEMRTHDRTAVPFLLWGRGIEPDQTERLTEAEARNGRLGSIDASGFLGLLLGR